MTALRMVQVKALRPLHTLYFERKGKGYHNIFTRSLRVRNDGNYERGTCIRTIIDKETGLIDYAFESTTNDSFKGTDPWGIPPLVLKAFHDKGFFQDEVPLNRLEEVLNRENGNRFV